MLVFGHRGAMGYEPENTLTSFKKAIELGAKAIELDVRRCRTGEIVCFHDDTLERTTNGTGHPEEYSLSELKSFRIDSRHEIPTLEEVLAFIDNRIIVNVELKGKDTVSGTTEIIDQYLKKKQWNIDNFMISSFNHHYAKEIKSNMPQIYTGALIKSVPLDYSECAIKCNANSLNIALSSVNSEIVNHAHRNGLKVFVYTVNLESELPLLINYKVDGVFSDYPDKIMNALKRML